MSEPEDRTPAAAPSNGNGKVAIPAGAGVTGGQANPAEATEFLEGEALTEAIREVRAAKRNPNDSESELVVVGMLTPDRRLSNFDRDLDRRVLQAVRKQFGIGSLPQKQNK